MDYENDGPRTELQSATTERRKALIVGAVTLTSIIGVLIYSYVYSLSFLQVLLLTSLCLCLPIIYGLWFLYRKNEKDHERTKKFNQEIKKQRYSQEAA